MALILKIGQMIGATSTDYEDDVKKAKKILSKVDIGLTEREKLELVQVLSSLNRYAEDYEENLPDKDIIDFVMVIKTENN